MGACYSVSVKIHLIDHDRSIKALNEHIVNDTSTNYSLTRYASIGVKTETFDDLMRILLAEVQRKVFISQEENFTFYENEFNASYGWERVMIEWFEVMAPFLGDGSQMLIYPDEDYDKLIIKNGKCVQVH